MSWRRLVPLALVVTGLLAVVALAAGGRPLGKSAGRGAGLPSTYWDYVFTTFVAIEVILFFSGLIALFLFRRDLAGERKTSQRRTLRAVAGLLLLAVLVTYFHHWLNLHRLFHPGAGTATTATVAPGKGANGHHHTPQPATSHVHIRWDELAVILAVLIVLGIVAYKTRPKRETGDPWRSAEALAAALDESLDDLRTDPDLRRAIIAAYARMEKALAAAGLPRHHAEAPLEYLERVLLELDTSAAAVRRLTDLFEWARFSHHEPEPSMRDEAIDALVAVRDELRASELTPA